MPHAISCSSVTMAFSDAWPFLQTTSVVPATPYSGGDRELSIYFPFGFSLSFLWWKRHQQLQPVGQIWGFLNKGFGPPSFHLNAIQGCFYTDRQSWVVQEWPSRCGMYLSSSIVENAITSLAASLTPPGQTVTWVFLCLSPPAGAHRPHHWTLPSGDRYACAYNLTQPLLCFAQKCFQPGNICSSFQNTGGAATLSPVTPTQPQPQPSSEDRSVVWRESRTSPVTFIISLDSSRMVAWISGIFTRLCIAFITSVLFCREPATLRTAEKERLHHPGLFKRQCAQREPSSGLL